MANTVTNLESQTRVEQFVFPDIDTSGAPDVGESEVDTKVDAEITQGFVGTTPSGS